MNDKDTNRFIWFCVYVSLFLIIVALSGCAHSNLMSGVCKTGIPSDCEMRDFDAPKYR